MKTNSSINFSAPLWFLFSGRNLLSEKAIYLLRNIDSKGSLSKAAEAVPMSYKSAWDLIDNLNNLSSQPLVVTSIGGRHGGGTILSEYGKSLLSLYSSLEQSYERIFSSYNDVKFNTDRLLTMMRGLCMKTSARNQLAGHLTKVIKGAVNAEITVDIGDKTNVVAVITNESTDNLSLEKGSDVIILVKASSVILFVGDQIVRCSTENKLRGKVTEIRIGMVNGEVLVQLPGGKIITSVITKESLKDLGITEGSVVTTAFSASQVIIALPM